MSCRGCYAGPAWDPYAAAAGSVQMRAWGSRLTYVPQGPRAACEAPSVTQLGLRGGSHHHGGPAGAGHRGTSCGPTGAPRPLPLPGALSLLVGGPGWHSQGSRGLPFSVLPAEAPGLEPPGLEPGSAVWQLYPWAQAPRMLPSASPESTRPTASPQCTEHRERHVLHPLISEQPSDKRKQQLPVQTFWVFLLPGMTV